ncbi:MAG: phosphoglycolate phosphatase [Burkholderiales bacterium]|nr:phosphoglycolate phosphatase [Burkholderiales bacterium]MBH2016760.1 phosphoglycolate phosphatase [Burkholderiales bacterium]
MVTDSIPLNQHPLTAAIIDLDGTLVDTLGDFVAVMQPTLADMGCHPVEVARVDRDFISHTVGKGTEDLLRRCLAHAWGLPDDAAEALAAVPEAWRHYQRHYERLNGQHAEVFSGVEAGLAQLHKLAVPLACLTNKPTAFAEQLLRAKGLRGHFLHVFGGDAFERKKPDPLPLLKTCEALGHRPSSTLMVGDSSNDAQAARAAGCPVLLVTYGYNHGQPIIEVPALAHVDRLDQVDWARLFAG